MRVKDTIGIYGEQVAVEHLQQAGFVVLERNWRCDIGEIDIVALDGATVVVCEVKTRSGLGFGSGLDAVTPQKLARLYRLALRWRDGSGRAGAELRVDVIAVHRRPHGGPEIVHVRGAQ
ncbi:YraN family protein [Jiangella endophytica]|uniref:YraN family protein n=1 Tax=Jiangella endophytica TaxID=1623398 RepID=UPI000E348974|nr:YraN family protein [Jiangella endophytica]